MAKYLVIVEAPGKLAKFSKLLGSDYKVLATSGHVVDLPPKGKNVKIEKDKQTGKYTFTPHYDIMAGKEQTVQNIINEAKKYQQVFLMTDSDREGEAISWAINNQLPKGTKVLRATTVSLTQESVDEALKNAGTIDLAMVDSYEARRILDRLVGYEASYPTKTATGGRSVGRVQSAALRLLSEREQEIKAFKPEEYWDIRAHLLTKKNEKVSSKLIKPDEKDIKNKEAADKVSSYLKDNKIVKVLKYETKTVETSAYAPFTTSTLQQSASSIFGWSGKKTMQLAQKLYEAGTITYHRSDSVFLSPTFLTACRTYIQQNFAPTYLPSSPNFYKTATKNAQEAHEACRATDVTQVVAGNTEDERKLYQLVWKRSVSCQMEKSRHLGISAKFGSGEYELSANGRKMLFDGWKKVYDYALSDDIILPEMSIDDELDIQDVISEQKFTQPPPRYTDGGSFTKLMDVHGIGRPATYAATLETLLDRSYVTVEKKSIHVTDLGIAVTDFLKKANFCFIDINFTASMEDNLDLIAEKKANKSEVLNEFYTRLKKDLENAAQIKKNDQESTIPCPTCGKMLLKKHSKFGPFLACPDRAECGWKANMDKDGNIIPPKPKAPVVYSSFLCPKCNGKMVERTSKVGQFLGCENFKTGCRSMMKTDGTVIVPKKGYSKKVL